MIDTEYKLDLSDIEIDDDVNFSVIEAMLRALEPDPQMTVNEWADGNRSLPPSNAEPGPFRTSRTPYIFEIGNKLSANSPAQKIIWKKSSQVAATELGNSWVGYTLDADPANFLYIMPTDAMMKSTSKNRIQKMIDTTESLQKKIKSSRTRDSGNTMLEKESEGGLLKMVGANSPVGLASFAAKKVYGDEVDRYPEDVGGEGDAIGLAETRTSTYGETRKIFLTSTPTLEGKSIIDAEFRKTGQRHYHVPCPECGCTQKLKPENLIWEKGKYDNVKYQCEHCDAMIEERHKTKMLDNGQWVPDFPEKEDGFTFGYFINALYSPLGWYSWKRWAQEYDEALENPLKMIVFVNTKMGECYSVEGISPAWESLYNKRETYKLNIPNKNVVFLTAGVDIQKDRIELEIVGWGKGKESWSVDYRVLVGNTDSVGNEVWAMLDSVIEETWTREDGALLSLRMVAVDSGDNTSVVYDYCKKWPTSKVIPVKGRANQALLVSQAKQSNVVKAGKTVNQAKVWNVGVSMIKTELYGWLNLQIIDDKPTPKGYCHFPMYDEHHFKSLTAEKLELKTNKKGYSAYEWTVSYKRNERLDCRVYARAASFILGIDRLTDEDWDRLLIETQDLIPENTQPEKPKSKRKGSGYW
jgi:phage terminase large subunit GpA-like protein